jgi:hypothetical protein
VNEVHILHGTVFTGRPEKKNKDLLKLHLGVSEDGMLQ